MTAADLGGEPGIRTRGSRPGPIDLGAAREEARIGEWDGAYGGFSAVDIDTLEPADLELLGHAAFWSEHPDASIAARQRAHAAYLVRGDPAGASRVALDLCLNHIARLRLAVAAGWLETARRLLGPVPEGGEHAHLAAVAALLAIATGGFETALVVPGSVSAAPCCSAARRAPLDLSSTPPGPSSSASGRRVTSSA